MKNPMLKQLNAALKMVCLVLAAVLVLRIARLAVPRNALKDLLDGPWQTLQASSLTAGETPALPGASSATRVNDTSPAPPQGKASVALTNSGPRLEMGKPASDLPPAIQARVDRIVQSEILGQVVRPLPMALLGIAGQDVFVRAPNGQTGLLRPGEELVGIKLLRIGTNRVLIEHEQQQKELTLFSGFGGEPLLPKPKPNQK